MKRTGAKNYRYTDVHWQCVPTRARFLCFWGDTPGRQFRENSHERARRSPGIDVQESDPPLPFAWQSAKADLGTRTSPQRSAKADPATGTSPRRSAKADLATGTSPRRSAKADLAARTSPWRSAKADLATGTSPQRSAKAPGGGLPAGHTGPGRAARKGLLHMRVRRACPFCAYPKRRKNYGVCYLAFLPEKSDECVAGRKRRRSPPRSRRRGREKPPGKGATP